MEILANPQVCPSARPQGWEQHTRSHCGSSSPVIAAAARTQPRRRGLWRLVAFTITSSRQLRSILAHHLGHTETQRNTQPHTYESAVMQETERDRCTQTPSRRSSPIRSARRACAQVLPLVLALAGPAVHIQEAGARTVQADLAVDATVVLLTLPAHHC